MSSVAQPDGYNKTFSDVNAPGADHAPAEMSLDAKIDVQFPMSFGGKMEMTQFKPDKNPDGVMDFQNSSSNPEDMPLPHGHSYSDFNQANDSRPRARFQDKVDVRTIIKGNPAIGNDTGASHS